MAGGRLDLELLERGVESGQLGLGEMDSGEVTHGTMSLTPTYPASRLQSQISAGKVIGIRPKSVRKHNAQGKSSSQLIQNPLFAI
jgi:hypothetical protein